MCGIVGIVERDLTRPVDGGELHRMVRMLVHRGPDDEGSIVARRLRVGDAAAVDRRSRQRPAAVQQRNRRHPCRRQRRDLQLQTDSPGARAGRPHVQEPSPTSRCSSTPTSNGMWHFSSRLRGMFALALWDGRSQTAHCRSRSRGREAALLDRHLTGFAAGL